MLSEMAVCTWFARVYSRFYPCKYLILETGIAPHWVLNIICAGYPWSPQTHWSFREARRELKLGWS